MPLWIGVIRNNWQLCVAGLFAILLLAMYARAETLKVETVKAQAAEKDAQDLLDTQLQIDAKVRRDNAAEAERHAKADATIDAQLQSAYHAHSLTADALTASVLSYQDSQHVCTVRIAQATKPGNSRPNGGGPATGANRPVEQSLATIPALAQKAVDQLRACQATLAERTAAH